ncbi:MAG: GGDEF domain-containing protein [Alphaproteobacteria bacterium]|nr:GGDEF domain-containing protein [Alphaproteobacteria bacterium]
MKFLSIFAGRKRLQRTAPDAEASEAGPQDGALRAAELLGVPQAHLTPQVRAAFNALMGEVDALRLEVDQFQLLLADAEASADYDPLVPVYNRRAFMRGASQVVAMVRRHEVEASLIYFDLNGFKDINDLHGHAAGDAVLRAVGETLIRQTRETDLVGRIGGDEFAVVLTHLNAAAASAKAETLAAAVCTDRVLHNGVPLVVNAAFGVSHFNAVDSAEQLLAAADEAMYADKALYRRARA